MGDVPRDAQLAPRSPSSNHVAMKRLYREYLRLRYAARLAKDGLQGEEPTFPALVSQACTSSQMRSPEYLEWCRKKKIDTVFRRKKWEYCYILQALYEQGQLESDKRGLGFGVGRECLVAALAAEGCRITATDLPHGEAAEKGWVETGQHAGALAGLNQDGICETELFEKNVVYRDVDMNLINDDLVGFDFVWSACALEHLGSIEAGKRFVVRAMDCLKPGGVAVHTTEFNMTSNNRTVVRGPTVLFRRRDLEDLAASLRALGHWVAPFNFAPGRGKLDRHIDLPPYRWAPHLRLLIGRYVATSFGFIVRKGEPGA
jgi:2-polyprenyl-3-methyl-5-hydroxy-6-metoxy-1,4-benzoquinol methylase